MRGRILGLAALCVLLSGCAGLPRPREMGDMALLRAMGVDAAGEEVKGAPCGKCFQLNSTHIPPLKQDDFDTMAFLTISQA